MSDVYQIFINVKSPEIVGSLWIHRSKCSVSSTFSYDEKWLRSRRCFPISPDLPLDVYPKTVEGLFSCFQDCSPDRWGRTLLNRAERLLAKAEHRNPRILLDSEYLLHVNDYTRQGALRIFDPARQIFIGDGGKDSVPPLIQLSRILHALDNLSGNREDKNDIMMLLAPGSSLGGARPKASVLDANGELHIAKFPNANDTYDVPMWEYVVFQLAKRAGLNVPPVRLEKINGRNVLLVKRFDRNKEARIPFLSAMSMIQARDGDHRSYADIACSLQSSGASPTEDMHELWSRMIFNMCIYNVDDHLRNHGFLHEPPGWRLSPLYDLEISTPDVAGPFLHTGVFDDGEALLDFDEPLRYAEFFRLSPEDAVRRIAGIQHAVSFWRYEAEKVRAKRSEMDHMAAAFEYMAARHPLNAR